MEPKLIQTTADTPALLIRTADLAEMMKKLDRLGATLEEIKNALPLKRRKLSMSTRRAHISCILERFEGKCPCCREVRIIDENGSPLPGCNEEHFVNRHENSVDKTWMVCQACNIRKATGAVSHSDVEALFKAYQVTLRKHLSESHGNGPYQVKLADSGRISGLLESKRHRKIA